MIPNIKNNILDSICNYENFYWAWNKFKRAYKVENASFNEIELFSYEVGLQKKIDAIISDIRNNNYKTDPIYPISIPKPFEDNKSHARQYFNISIRDQLSWLAVMNIIGPLLDRQMLFWSYGSRLYISMFKKIKGWGFEYYRQSTGQIYRNWRQSWPLFRKHISITAKLMANPDLVSYDDFEKEELEVNLNRKTDHPLKNLFIMQDYWSSRHLSGDIYWINLDLEKFYQSIHKDTILSNIKENLSKYYSNLDVLLNLISNLLSFTVNIDSWNPNELQKIQLDSSKFYYGIPTGLIVGSFLANISMMSFDRKIYNYIFDKNMAIFRFVDDYTILSDNFDSLRSFVKYFSQTLSELNPNVKINFRKTKPKEFQEIYNSKKEISDEEIKIKCKLDPEYPKPLMTKTLNELSLIANLNFDLLDNNEQIRLIEELLRLAIIDFPEDEVKKDTLVSFAISRLMFFIPKLNNVNNEDLCSFLDLYNVENKIIELESENDDINKKEVKTLKSDKRIIIKKIDSNFENYCKKIANLLEKSVCENYTKLVLWRRLIQFYRNSGINRIKILFEKLSKLEDKLFPVSYFFLVNYIHRLYAYEIINNYRIYKNPLSNPKQKKISKKFLDSVSPIQIKHNTNNKYQENIDFRYYQFIMNIAKLNYKIDHTHHESYSFNQVCWWFCNKFIDISSLHVDKKWSEIINSITVFDDFSKSIFQMYPNSIPSTKKDLLLKKYPCNISFLPESSFDITEKGYISLYKWVISNSQYILKNTYENYKFDVRISEWTSIVIIRHIINYILEDQNANIRVEDIPQKSQSQSFLSINPFNILIPNFKQNYFSWINWKSMFYEDGKLKDNIIKYIYSLEDHRYDIKYYTFDSEIDEDFTYVFSLGVLLITLLSNNNNFPGIYNPTGFNKIKTSSLFKKIYDIQVSSYTLSIIKSCLSNVIKERHLVEAMNLNFFIDSNPNFAKDNLIINNLQDLDKYLSQSQDDLEKFQLSLAENIPKQIVPLLIK